MDFPLKLIIGSYNHVPAGIGDDEMERIYIKKLKPLIVNLDKYPRIQTVLHYSGVLLQRIEKIHPEFFMLMKDLVARKQVELLGGGFHEPLLPLLPQPDKIGQIELLTTYLRREFGKRPLGCWLPALAWEQNLPGVLNTCGMAYTFLSEEQFLRAGLSGEDLYSPCISEDQGKLITVFPFSNPLAADFLREKPSRVLEKLAREGTKRVISIFPGLRPAGGNFASDEEIQGFFEDLSRCESFVEFTTPGKLCKTLRGLKKAYFPGSAEGCFSPGEAVPRRAGPGDVTGRDAGGSPRQFLINYPEANGIYSKMMFVNVLINQLRGDKSRKRTAREELWKAQGYDVFCPTPYGGIYRNTTRNAVYRALLGAERITREKGGFVPSLSTFDFDLDGEGEYLFQDTHINCYIKARGASVFELDYLPKTWNYLDTLAPGRLPPEALSRQEEGLRRTAFADFLSPFDSSFRDLVTGPPPESPDSGILYGDPRGRPCGLEQYEPLEVNKTQGKLLFRLPPKPELPFGCMEIEKSFCLKKDTLTVRYRLTNRGTAGERCSFIPRLDLAFPGEGESYQRMFALVSGLKEPVLREAGELVNTGGVEFRDLKNEVTITLNAGLPFDLWFYPLRIPSGGNGRAAEWYQSTCVMPVNRISLEPDAFWESEYTLRISQK
ncbi:MAG: DUF1925 domain-containing protein [Spirochaetaceae bacterium]|jgi:hypothetical protein|nr:DUF1925 domain-containing protein [Spirochaetaceae bacterium]